jgi:hypothetical protein
MNTPISPRLLLLGAALLSVAACGQPVTPTPVKLAGVGLQPDDVGPTPNNYGGVVEYDLVNFAGAGLPLGLVGLVSYDAVGPDFMQMKPPYSMIYGLAFVMETDLPATDTLFGSFGVPPEVEGSCYTNFEPQAYLNNTADVGTAVTFVGDEDGISFSIGRRPLVYPKNNVENLFAYYSDLDVHITQPLVGLADPGDGAFSRENTRVIEAANWLPGASVAMTFPGGIPPEDAGVGSIPSPLAAGPGSTFTLPEKPTGVMMSWKGPVYDADGNLLMTADELGDEGYSTCLQFLAHESMPQDPEDCLALQEPPGVESTFSGQMYTGPWDTEDGSVTVKWVPGSGESSDLVTISVRFLGPVDLDDENKLVATVNVPLTESITAYHQDAFIDQSGVISGGEFADDHGTRSALACEVEGDDFTWETDPSLLASDGGFVTGLQGEPTATLADVTCNAGDSGSFTITNAMIADALDYATRNKAEGAIFYMTRTSVMNVDTPPVRDRYGQRRDISDVRVLARSVELGRFWFQK